MNCSPKRPAVEFATGEAVFKGEDLVLVRPRVSFPKSFGGGRLVQTFDKTISDSASSVHVSANGLQESLSLSEQDGGGSSLKTTSSRGRQGSLQGTESFGLFCVFDGHNGVNAIRHLESVLLTTLEEKLPAGHPPVEDDEPAYTKWREELQKALVTSFCELNEDFACSGQSSGATITVVLQYGWLLTVASCGDSRALLDTGVEIMQLSVDHRISTHQGDRRRLEALGAQIAPIDGSGSGPALTSAGYGPLRVWPGGLCLSRGIGDFDIGPPVIACPHIFQVKVPDCGGRLIIASDGVWDGFGNMKRLCRLSRGWACQAAPNKVIQALQRAYGGLRDDTSLVVLDVMPPGAIFSEAVQSRPKRQGSAGGSCLCFSPPVELEDKSTEVFPEIEVLADLDIAAAIGLMPSEYSVKRPVWCDDDFCSAICKSQIAACNAWNEARTMRSMGKKPSRQDLASFFSAVHHVRPLPDARKFVDPHDLDITSRPQTTTKLSEDGQAFERVPKSRRDSQEMQAEGTQGDASTRFREHVADQKSFARKFGHYKHHMANKDPAAASEEGSTTEDDSTTLAGSQHAVDDSNSESFSNWQAQARDAGWTPPPAATESMHSPRHRAFLYQMDSAMNNSSGSLPTVAEELQIPKPKGQETVTPPPEDDDPNPKPAAEMAVRRGKNRFMTQGSKGSPQGAAHSRGWKPPLPVKN